MKKTTDMPAPRTIDEYLSFLSEKEQEALCRIWEIVKEIVPNSEDVISHQIPILKHHGMLVGFGAFKKHLSFYAISMTILEEFKEELKDFNYCGGTIQFSLEKQLPADLIERIVRKRVAMNEAKTKIKAEAKKNKI
jgi:uncharacterized protein YdhG (YjbR/CyaY superfamily)